MTTPARASMPTAQTAHTRRERGFLDGSFSSAPRPGHFTLDKCNHQAYIMSVSTQDEKANR